MVLGLGPNGFARLGGGFPLPLLFDNWIGRKRDVGGGVLAGLCCVGLFGASWTDACDGVRRDTDGHVSKFIALLRQRAGTSGDGLALWFAGADVFGTRQECRGSASFSGENADVLANENEDVFVK